MPPSARRGPWSTAEDTYLLNIVAQQGPHNWVRISQLVRSRTPKQCRERFHQNLKPSLNHEPITAEEGELIERLVNEMGKKWAEIARQLNGRSDNAVKNWWNGGQNRRRRMSDRRRSSDQHSHPAAVQAQQQQRLDPYYSQHQLHHHHHHHHHALPVALEHQPTYAQAPAYHAAAPTNRPSPLTIQPHPAYGTRPYDTPMPSPSSQSIVSTEGAPSLVTDNGSETRSPHYAASPMEHGLPLPPLIGRRDERRHSSVLFLSRDGSFVTEDEAALMQQQQQQHDKLQQRDCRRLPEPAGYSPRGPAFREPNYAAARQMPHLTQPLDSAAASPSAFPHQRQLPGFHTLAADAGRVPYLPPVESRYPSPPQSFSHERPCSPPSASKPSNLASLLN